jgi:hypothetical protein
MEFEFPGARKKNLSGKKALLFQAHGCLLINVNEV